MVIHSWEYWWVTSISPPNHWMPGSNTMNSGQTPRVRGCRGRQLLTDSSTACGRSGRPSSDRARTVENHSPHSVLWITNKICGKSGHLSTDRQGSVWTRKDRPQGDEVHRGSVHSSSDREIWPVTCTNGRHPQISQLLLRTPTNHHVRSVHRELHNGCGRAGQRRRWSGMLLSEGTASLALRRCDHRRPCPAWGVDRLLGADPRSKE